MTAKSGAMRIDSTQKDRSLRTRAAHAGEREGGRRADGERQDDVAERDGQAVAEGADEAAGDDLGVGLEGRFEDQSRRQRQRVVARS